MLTFTQIEIAAIAFFALTGGLLWVSQQAASIEARRLSVYVAFLSVALSNSLMFLSYRGEKALVFDYIAAVQPDAPVEPVAVDMGYDSPRSSPGDTQASGTFAQLLGNAPTGQRTDCDDCPEMVDIPAGFFEMGADAGVADARPQELPRVRVRIGRGFALSKHEITVRQFAAFRAATGWSGGGCSVAGAGDDDRPIDCISWNDAVRYARWLTHRTGERYRLPSAAEWEYAARAGGDGKTISARDFVGHDAAPLPRARGGGLANGFGLHDMTGNLAEMTADCWTASLAYAPTDGSAAAGDGGCARRVVKDAHWREPTAWARVSARRAIDPDKRVAGVGLRVVRETSVRVAGR